jgi:hypothetical protein
MLDFFDLEKYKNEPQKRQGTSYSQMTGSNRIKFRERNNHLIRLKTTEAHQPRNEEYNRDKLNITGVKANNNDLLDVKKPASQTLTRNENNVEESQQAYRQKTPIATPEDNQTRNHSEINSTCKLYPISHRVQIIHSNALATRNKLS